MKPHPAQWWYSESSDGEGTLVCELCPRQCHIAEGKAGYCFGRQNLNRQLVSAVYGRSMGFCIDPIEKKPLYHFLPGSPTLSFGTIGCNLGCRHCQNWQTSRCHSLNALVEQATPEMIAETAMQLACPSVSLTYNEPIVWAEFAVDTARACRKLGIKTVAVTNGYIRTEPAKWFFEYIDAANIDLKSFRVPFYRNIADGALQSVLDTLIYLAKETGVWLEVTNLIIPGENDSPDELKDLCNWIATELGGHIPLHFSAFHPAYQLLHRPPTDAGTLLRAYAIARSCGLRHVYLGNLASAGHQTTYCGHCGVSLLERNAYGAMVTDNILLSSQEDGNATCHKCGKRLAGFFASTIGTWGNRRQNVVVGRQR